MAKFRMSIGKIQRPVYAPNIVSAASGIVNFDNFNDRNSTSGPNDWVTGTSGLIYNLGRIEWVSISDDQLITVPGVLIPGHEYRVIAHHEADSIGNRIAIRAGRYGVEDAATGTARTITRKNILCVEDDYLQIKMTGSSTRDQKLYFLLLFEWIWNQPIEVDLPPEINDAELVIEEDSSIEGRSIASISSLTFWGQAFEQLQAQIDNTANFGGDLLPYSDDFVPILIEYSEDNGGTWKQYFEGRISKTGVTKQTNIDVWSDAFTTTATVLQKKRHNALTCEVESTDIADIINSRKDEKVGMELYSEPGFTGLPQLWCDVDGNTYAYELHEALRYIVCYLTDGRARLESNYFEAYLEEQFASRHPVLMPFNPGGGDYGGFRVSFGELFDELRKWFGVTLNFYKPNGIPTVRIENTFYNRENFRLYRNEITIENQRNFSQERLDDLPNLMTIGQPKLVANSEDFEPIEVFGGQNNQSGQIDAITNLVFDSTAAGAQDSDVALYQAVVPVSGNRREETGANDKQYYNRYTLTGAGTTFQDNTFPLIYGWRYSWPSFYQAKYYDYNSGNDQIVATNMLGIDYVAKVEMENVLLSNAAARQLENRSIGPNELYNWNFALGNYQTAPSFLNKLNGWESDRYGTNAGSWVYRYNPGAVEIRYADPSGAIFYQDLGRNFGDELKISYIGWAIELERIEASDIQNCKLELAAFDDSSGPVHDFTMLEIGSGTSFDPDASSSLYVGGYFSGITDISSGSGNADIRYVGLRVTSTGSGASLSARIKWIWIYDPFNLGAINQSVQFGPLYQGRITRYSRQIRNGITNLELKTNAFI